VTGRQVFDPRQRQCIFPLASVSRPDVRPTQPPIQRVQGVYSRVYSEQSRDLTTHPTLVPRLRMSRIYILSPLWQLNDGSGTALRFFALQPSGCSLHHIRYDDSRLTGE
jgi:hypothetical protein